MLKVFSPSDKIYTTNGDCVLQPLKAKVHKEDNGAFYLDLECPISYSNYLQSNNIIVANTPQGDQAFRISNPEFTRSKVTLKANHIFYDSQNYLISDSYVVEKNCNDALDHLNSATETKSPFTTLSNISTIDSFRCVRKSLYEAISTVIDRWGGHLVRDNWNIKILDSIGNDNGITIRYGKNLESITCKYNWDEVVTKLLPVGKDGILLNDVDATQDIYVYSSTNYDIPFTKTVSFDQTNINEDDYKDSEGNTDTATYKQALLNDLKTQAQAYVDNHCIPQVNYTVKASIDKITDVGDTIVVEDERLGINIVTHLISYEYDCIQDRYTELEFGNFEKKLSNLITTITNTTNESIKTATNAINQIVNTNTTNILNKVNADISNSSSDIINQTNASIAESNNMIGVILNEKLEEATQKIWGEMSDSYVIYSGDKILIVDSLPKENAHNCILINNEGIGFSTTGINGTFTSAWTIDGTLNMQAINVINFSANLIKGGTLKLGSNLNEYGTIEVYNESNTLISKLDKNGLVMYAKDGGYLVMNSEVGFAGYDNKGNKIYWVSHDEFHMKKSVVEDEITLCNKLRYIPITLDGSDGIGIVSVAGSGGEN